MTPARPLPTLLTGLALLTGAMAAAATDAVGGASDLASAPRAEAAVSTAAKVVIGALIVGLSLAGLFLWRLWRQPRPAPATAAMSGRIDAAASGLPGADAMKAWPKEKLCAVCAGLAEFESYTARRRADGAVDLELHKRDEPIPRALVSCVPGRDGLVGSKTLHDLHATIAKEGVQQAWIVSPAGFTTDARDYAALHRMVLLDCEGLHTLMREAPPLSLPGVLARE